MSHPLNSRRWAGLCDQLNSLIPLLREYLVLRIETMKEFRELSEKRAEKTKEACDDQTNK